ncbi:hypothetical protein A2982_01225 [candidate division WWE3 bacterium RIFCSPLOWO2_01_FULL_39_13]|uniref:Glycosyltransferase 2-like domain-containing protein n=1 Tax=candidate division WWE3 bacterium RIFCSPLOWO2_01_FULL_39_13 TaxID=1802624 RepID=A0A1F4V2H8_UNCKA|nr:MAG: hypothetical protein A2982_01225 [candidate division WWE3 bacterium RIFCSPLOWO2_01_FULL_39_13]
MKGLSIVIVSYNTRDILKKCLSNLKTSAPGVQVIVVDNNSSDGSVNIVEADFSGVELIKLKENKGLAWASNIGLKHAKRDFVLYLGSDAFPSKETLEGMLSYMKKHPEVGIATPRLELRNGKEDKDAHRGFPTLWTSFTHFSHLDKIFSGTKLFDRYFMGYKDFLKEQEVDLCISHFMFIRKEVFKKAGIWDEDFFVYGEDVDFCYRAKQAGWKIMYLPQFTVLHYKGAGVGIRKETQDISPASKETRKRMAKASTRAMLTFYRKHYIKRYPKIAAGLVYICVLVLERLRLLKINRQ